MYLQRSSAGCRIDNRRRNPKWLCAFGHRLFDVNETVIGIMQRKGTNDIHVQTTTRDQCSQEMTAREHMYLISHGLYLQSQPAALVSEGSYVFRKTFPLCGSVFSSL